MNVQQVRDANLSKWHPVCIHLPPNINSHGVWSHWNPMNYSLPMLHMQMFLIFFVTQAIHFILQPLGLPKIVSQMIAGLFLGPTALGRINNVEHALFPLKSQDIIGTLSLFGYTLFMFLTGVKMDMRLIMKTGIKATITGVLALVAPLVVGIVTLLTVAKKPNYTAQQIEYLSILTASHSLTPFPVISSLLDELKLLNSELGRLALSSAVVSDLFSVILMTIGTLGRKGLEKNPQSAGWDLLSIIVFMVVAIFIFRPMMFWVIRQTPEGRPIKELYLVLILLAVLASGIASHMFGHYVLFGPFILGLCIPDGPPLGSALVDKLDTLVSGWLMPLFITTCTLRADVFSIFVSDGTQNQLLPLNTIIVITTFLVKITASIVPPLCCKLPFNDALTLALIMSCKGAVEMATYSFLRDNEIIDQATFSMMTISTLLAASLVTILVKKLYDPSRKYAGYQKRSILHAKSNSELRILACIHRPDNTPAAINMLHAGCPTKENPLAVYVLHLIELAGRATPLFISHQMQKRVISKRSYSENVIQAFSNYERKNSDCVWVQVYTAVSPPNLMHEDICTLALNKLTSLIVLPFHRKWARGGRSIESDDRYIRTLNCSVLDRAPCSVAILVDRGHSVELPTSSIESSQTEYSVAVIFFGGNDDREAVAYAKRIAKYSGNIRLTIIHFIAAHEDDDKDKSVSTSWEKMLDTEILKEIKIHKAENRNTSFMEKVVEDGPQTALIVRSMADAYDLIIVGRRHNVDSDQTSGLVQWCEFPELGIMGDLLISVDLNSKASVLVVQQQKQC